MTNGAQIGWYQEGKAIFQIGPSFYRSASARTRDFGVLAAAVYRRQHGHLQVLDLMTGCGVRALRYGLESDADFLWVNDGNADLHPLIQKNLATHFPSERYQLSVFSAQRLLAQMIDRGDRVDWLDLDCFGSPAAMLPMAIATTRIGGCLYLTATDGKSLSGQQSSSAFRQFGAYTRHHPAVHEQAIRVLIGLAVQMARQQGLNVLPLFSLFCGQTYRVLLRLLPKAPAGDQDVGFLGYCHHCGQFHVVGWRSLGMARCHLHADVRPLVLSGPLWLGPLHHPQFLAEMIPLAQEWTWWEHVKQLCLMQTEAPLPPYYFLLSEIGKRGQMDIPARETLLQILRHHGHQACRSSLVSQAIKTTASLPEVITLSRGMQDALRMRRLDERPRST